jgi:uncharacterized membrane protein YeiH
LITFIAHPALKRLERPILLLDATGLALFCVTGAATALNHQVGAVEAVILGAITGVGGGALRDVSSRLVLEVWQERLGRRVGYAELVVRELRVP